MCPVCDIVQPLSRLPPKSMNSAFEACLTNIAKPVLTCHDY